MKRPCTSQPCSFKRREATAESTPPERPTMTKEPEDEGMGRNCTRALDVHRRYTRRRVQVKVCDRVEGQAGAPEVVLDTAHHQGAAQPRLALPQIFAREPMRAYDSPVQGLRGIMVLDLAGEGEPHVGSSRGRGSLEVDSNKGLRLKPPGRLFANLTHHRREQSLPLLDLTGGLVEDEAEIDALFDQEEAASSLRNGGDRDIRRTCHVTNYSGRVENGGHMFNRRAAQPRLATRKPCSAALAFQILSNS